MARTGRGSPVSFSYVIDHQYDASNKPRKDSNGYERGKEKFSRKVPFITDPY